MKYIKLVIEIADEYQESLIAELFDMDFDGFEQREDSIVAYITKESLGIGDREQIDQLLGAYPGDGYIKSEEVVAEQNWNAQWEQTIKAQSIGQFFVKPTWSQASVPNDKILLEIDPKMSFGTGYHETTRLMLEALAKLLEGGETIIDAGTGTGILSIAAIKLGAKEALAFDINEWSITNTKENILLNGVSEDITVKLGSSEVIADVAAVDLIMANIEKNVILSLLDDFIPALKQKGKLLLSGLLETDLDQLKEELKPHFEILEVYHENEWIAVFAKKITS
ncbi:50S ribosomal protein L11 methyltransferase [Fodinibius halophilus]|uniref:Ribosomal protein L11 methyltransferase n=1 Tax=Fodinibius halophilus TaxID=1736908 RepID=A0A6M1TH04_9BACT|nr:50S ribosomal protein L11 methyltransferase [Fodinibius halophilus]NGP87930.1 50S ribosomal protein L11 methyltransferase [Fodinibius halophilus]